MEKFMYLVYCSCLREDWFGKLFGLRDNYIAEVEVIHDGFNKIEMGYVTSILESQSRYQMLATRNPLDFSDFRVDRVDYLGCFTIL